MICAVLRCGEWNLYSVSRSKRVLKVVPRISVIRDGTKIQNGCRNQCGGSSSVERPESTREYQPNLSFLCFETLLRLL